jgi:predicted nucleic acid-binding protein
LRLATLMNALAFDAVPIDQAVAQAWALLRILLRDGGLKMPVDHSWIAATAMMLGVPIVAQDDDYVEIGNLSVSRV